MIEPPHETQPIGLKSELRGGCRRRVVGLVALTLIATSAHAEDTVPRHDGRFTSGVALVTIGSVLLVATSLGTGIPGIVLLATSKTPTWSDTHKTSFAPPSAFSIPIFSTSF
jgi:hypothetical protein